MFCWDHKNVILWIIKRSLSLFAFSLSWQLPGDSSGRNLPLGGGPAQMSAHRAPGGGLWHLWHCLVAIISPGGGACDHLTSGLRSASDTRYWSFILITKTPASRYIFSLMIIDFSRVCSHTRHGLLVPGSLPLCCCHQVEKQAFWHPDGGKTSLFTQ